MPSRTEMLGHKAIGGEKALGMSWGLEAFGFIGHEYAPYT